jgi:ABC-type polar amino acid transport system ATPase subunit
MMLSFQDVAADVGAGQRLCELRLDLAPGDVAAFSGPAEARAAFADLATGMRDPDSGRVTWAGRAWAGTSPAACAALRAAIGCALDRPSFISNLDVGENLVLAERMHGRRSEREVLAEAEALAERLHLGAIPDSRPHALSVRALHRMAIVRALLGARQLLIVETVANALSPRAVAAVCEELRARARAGAAVAWLGETGAPPELATTASFDLAQFTVGDGEEGA